MADQTYKGLGTERVTVDATSGGKALASIPTGAVFALARVKGAAICWTDDGVTAPTATVGQETLDGEAIWLDVPLSKFKAIRRDSTSATLIVSYYEPAN